MERLELTDAIESGKPFSLRVVDGETYEITSEELIRVHPGLDQVTIFDKNGAFHFYKLGALTLLAELPSSAIVSRADLEAVIDSGKPFTIQVSGSREYQVPHRDYIFLPPRGTYIIVANDSDEHWVIPYSTILAIKSGS